MLSAQEEAEPSPRLAALLSRMPPPLRAAAEALFVLALVFVSVPNLASRLSGGSASVDMAVQLILYGFLVGSALWLARARGERQWLINSALLLLSLGGIFVVSAREAAVHENRGRLGIELETAPGVGGSAVVRRVLPGKPASGLLSRGDEIVAIDTWPLDRKTPGASLVKYLARVPKGRVLLWLRKGDDLRPVEINLPEVHHEPDTQWPHGVRAIAVLLAVVALMLSDGQGARQLGFSRDGVLHELAVGALSAPALAIATLVGAFPFAVALLPESGSELRHFAESSASAGAPGAVLALRALSGEVTFRGFLVPRLKAMTKRWVVALVLSAVLFSFQYVASGRMVMAAMFSWGLACGGMFLWRGRIEAILAARATLYLVAALATPWLSSHVARLVGAGG